MKTGRRDFLKSAMAFGTLACVPRRSCGDGDDFIREYHIAGARGRSRAIRVTDSYLDDPAGDWIPLPPNPAQRRLAVDRYFASITKPPAKTVQPQASSFLFGYIYNIIDGKGIVTLAEYDNVIVTTTTNGTDGAFIFMKKHDPHTEEYDLKIDSPPGLMNVLFRGAPPKLSPYRFDVSPVDPANPFYHNPGHTNAMFESGARWEVLPIYIYFNRPDATPLEISCLQQAIDEWNAKFKTAADAMNQYRAERGITTVKPAPTQLFAERAYKHDAAGADVHEVANIGVNVKWNTGVTQAGLSMDGAGKNIFIYFGNINLTTTDKITIMHELGHILNASHVEKFNSMMSASAGTPIQPDDIRATAIFYGLPFGVGKLGLTLEEVTITQSGLRNWEMY